MVRSRSQSGFGRLDIAVLLVCVGMLAAVAVPRHFQLARQTRTAEINALRASVASASDAANALWRSAGEPLSLALAGGDVAIVNGYPSAGTVGNALAGPEALAFRFDAGRWQHRDAPGAGSCGIIYRPPARPGEPPLIRTDASGC